MSFIKNLFGGSNEDVQYHTDFKEGDIFYSKMDNQYFVYKLLIIDDKFKTFHLTAFEPAEFVPTPENIKDLNLRALHTPISSTGFDKVVFIANAAVNEDDLMGYFAYIKHTRNIDEIVKYAKKYYKEAWHLAENKDLHNAIRKYSLAIDLLPNFVEALDNRAFCYIDAGALEKAVEGFEASLKVKPDSFLALFSVGKCYFQLKKFDLAKDRFEKAALIDPSHPHPKIFLKHINEM